MLRLNVYKGLQSKSLLEREREISIFRSPLLFLILFFLALYFNIWKAKFCLSSVDESLYLSIPYRVLQGDLLLIHEWHCSQMNAFLLAPLLKVYLLIFNSVEGITLHFRYIYVFFHSLTALFIYFSLREHNAVAATACAVMYELFCFNHIMALSYNTMGIGLMLFASLGLIRAGKRNLLNFLSGLAFAGATLCCPYLVLVYLLYTVSVLFSTVRKGSAVSPALSDPLRLRTWICFTAACFCLAGLFFYPLLHSGMICLLPKTLPRILFDPEHPKRTFLTWARTFLHSFPRYNSMFWPSFCGGLILAVFMLLDKKRIKRRVFYLLWASAVSFVFSFSYLLMYRSPSYLVFPIHILGIFSYFLCEGIPDFRRRFLMLSFLPGMLYSVCADLASNNSFFIITSVSVVSMPASFLFVFQLLREILFSPSPRGRIYRGFGLFSCFLAVLFIAALSAAMIWGRMDNCFRGGSPREMSAVFQYGSQKGVHDTPERVAAYDSLYESLEHMRSHPGENVLYWSGNSFHYLEDGKRCSSYSMWLTDDGSYNLSQLESYWSLFPEKIPDCVFLPMSAYETGAVQQLLCDYSYTLELLDAGAVLYFDREK